MYVCIYLITFNTLAQLILYSIKKKLSVKAYNIEKLIN